MSRRRRQSYEGCAITSLHGRLRLRFRLLADGKPKQASFATPLPDTAENRKQLEPIRELAGALIRAGHDPRPQLRECFSCPVDGPPAVPLAVGPTVADYYPGWYAERAGRVRPAQARDYRRHIGSYVLPSLGSRLLVDLKPKDVRGLQAELLARTSKKTGKPLSEKFVKNILCGSFQAMLRQAKADELVLCDPFAGLEWSRYDYPEPDPFEPEERDAILDWFASKRFSFHAGPGAGVAYRLLPHPHYHAYLHLLFWHGARPSEASGFCWKHVDLKKGLAHVRQSYHMGKYGKPKTKAARRTIELHPFTVTLLRALKPLREAPDLPVFVNTEGNPIEPKAFSERWYDCLRALGLRQRGLYTTKDTFVTLTLATGREDVMLWLVQQTGVAYDTLRRHYAKWLPKPDRGMWEKLDPSLAERHARPVAGAA